MNWSRLCFLVAVIAWALCGAFLLYALNLGQIKPIEGTKFVDVVELCDDINCTKSKSQKLPFFTSKVQKYEFDERRFKVTIEAKQAEQNFALYLPKLSDKLSLRINNVDVFKTQPEQRLWNTPLFIPLHNVAGATQKLELDLSISGPATEGLDLHPFYYGEVGVLQSHYWMRYFVSVELARFSTGLMLVFSAIFLVAWSVRRQDKVYLWLGLTGASAVFFLVHYGYGAQFLSYKIWTIIWTSAPIVYTLLATKFIYRFVGLDRILAEHLNILALVILYVILFASPEEWTFKIGILGNVFITAPSAFCGLFYFWSNRHKVSRVDLTIFYLTMSSAASLGLFELYLLLSAAPSRSLHLFHIMPLEMSLTFIWLLLSQLTTSLDQYDRLTKSLNQTIDEKTAELEASFEKLVEVQKKEAISDERNRIMLDLHDGIGGQLVSTLAYMNKNETGDETIQSALESSLRDLALMLDSMENHDSLVTQLGMLRTRLEELLSEQGIKFNWQVHGEPTLAEQTPSHALHLARIVQEAITNVIKHAKADTITIFVDESKIQIADNGGGFDVDKLHSDTSNGLTNMQRRARLIGAEFQIVSIDEGTVITLGLS